VQPKNLKTAKMNSASRIEEWRNKVPWQTNEQVEQDLILYFKKIVFV